MPRVAKDLTGQRFGKWTVLRLNKIDRGNRVWWCRCDCGFEKAHYSRTLKIGASMRCAACRRAAERGKPRANRRLGTVFSADELRSANELFAKVLRGEDARAVLLRPETRRMFGKFERMLLRLEGREAANV